MSKVKYVLLSAVGIVGLIAVGIAEEREARRRNRPSSR